MTSSEIRQKFLDFFKSKGHKIVPSAPIVVKDDPTLMFTNAGMNQFKDYFLGNQTPENPRIADTQKCLRVSGKHNDLEEVGVDTYHHTMFEMLGNWSIGDYFKKEAIEWSWELLTKVYGLPKDRLYVTVFEGDASENLPPSSVALVEWKKWVEEDKYSNKGASFAISAYLRTLLTNEAPFQKWLKGNSDAMTEQEKQGASIFFGKAGCVTCHYEKNLGSMNFAALGVKDHYEMGGLNTSESDRRNLGRGGFTGKDEDMYKFRTPQLYNLGDSGPYFHGGSKNSLEEVVRYFNAGVVENSRVPKTQIAEFIKPIGLSEEEIQALTQFLQNGLRDPNLKRYVPSSVLSRMCFPNNDLTSKIDMDCF